MRSLSESNASRDALHCEQWMPRKNSSMLAQYVIDSFNCSVNGSGLYISFTSYIVHLG